MDAFYNLPSTLNKKGSNWARRTETKEELSIMKAVPGSRKYPAANHYDVKRLYEEVSLDSQSRS